MAGNSSRAVNNVARPLGVVIIAAMLALEALQAPSVRADQISSKGSSGVSEHGPVHSAMKLVIIYDLMADRATKEMANEANSTTHLPMRPVASLFSSMSPNGYEVGTIMSWPRK